VLLHASHKFVCDSLYSDCLCMTYIFIGYAAMSMHFRKVNMRRWGVTSLALEKEWLADRSYNSLLLNFLCGCLLRRTSNM
jgi:hypothetical protein